MNAEIKNLTCSAERNAIRLLEAQRHQLNRDIDRASVYFPTWGDVSRRGLFGLFDQEVKVRASIRDGKELLRRLECP